MTRELELLLVLGALYLIFLELRGRGALGDVFGAPAVYPDETPAFNTEWSQGLIAIRESGQAGGFI